MPKRGRKSTTAANRMKVYQVVRMCMTEDACKVVREAYPGWTEATIDDSIEVIQTKIDVCTQAVLGDRAYIGELDYTNGI